MSQKKVFPLRIMILCSLLIAVEIVLARFAGIQINEGIRISIETVPLVLGSFWLGPLWGMLIAVLADILGTLLSGYGVYFPLLTVGPVLLTLIIGLAGMSFRDIKDGRGFYLRFIAIVLLAEIVNTLYGTWALTIYFSVVVGEKKAFGVLLAARLTTKPVTILVDTVLSCLLHRSLYTTVVAKYLSASGSGRNQ